MFPFYIDYNTSKLLHSGYGAIAANYRDWAMADTSMGCKNVDGRYCSAIIMADGWKIADDSP